MKILLTSILTFPGAGGIWTYVLELAKGLRSLGHTVDILAVHPGTKRFYLFYENRMVEDKSITELVSRTLALHRQTMSQLGGKINLFEWRRYRLELVAASLRLKQYDLIHAQEVFSAIALSRVKPKDIPLVTTIHGAIRDEFIIKGILNPSTPKRDAYVTKLEKTGIMSSTSVIVPTKYMKNRFITDFQVPENHISIIPLGFNLDQFRVQMEQPTDIQKAGNQKVIICSARLEREKGHIYLLEALQKLRKVRTDWKCLLAGSGSLHKMLKDQCVRLGLNKHVVFLGYRRDIPALLRESDIFVLASIQENHPYAIMEAQAAGKAVIGSSAGGIPELIEHQKTGLVFPKKDSHSLFLQLSTVLENQHLRDSLSSQAREFADGQWAVETMLNRVVANYTRLALTAKGRKSFV